MKRTIAIATLLLCVCSISFAADRKYQASSPDGQVKLTVSTGETISYSVSYAGRVILSPSEISMTLGDGTVYGGNAKVKSVGKASVSNVIDAVVYRSEKVSDCYNELKLSFAGFNLVFRVFDDAVAYRFVSKSKKPFVVKEEQSEFSFPGDWTLYTPYVKQNTSSLQSQFHNSFENLYTVSPVSQWDKSRLAFLPLLVDAGDGLKICISESDLRDYPGMYLYNGDSDLSLGGVWAPAPVNRNPEPGNRVISMYVDGVHDYIASCTGARSFPWRVMAISTSDEQLTTNDVIYRLAEPQDPSQDYSWVKPGKVAWDWWNAWNIYGVDFKAGINTQTYKYYVDFASSKGIEYVILDEGWSPGDVADLYQVVPEIDLEGLIDYASSKNVGIILWAGFYPFQKDIEGICKHYSQMGVKGFKVDFLDSDDQGVVSFVEESAAIASKYHLMLDFHGMYKPTGLSRTYPNVVNYEGVYGLEQMKWGAAASQVDYDVTIPFIRLFAGSADYTQGAMRNAVKGNIASCYTEPMSPGTRCHQLGEYVVFFSPLNMLCDSPSNYIREPECTDFIAAVPTVWDQTVALPSKLGEYVVTARRSGNTWYVGGINNWDARDITVDLSFLGDGDYCVELFRDGINADCAARDYSKYVYGLSDRKLEIHMAPGGGFAARIDKE